MRPKNLLLTVSAVLLFLFTASLALAAPIGKVTLVTGRVDVLKSGENLATPVKLGDAVDVGDIYRAKTKSNAEITFTNKNILKIAPATRVEIKEYMVDEQKTSQVIRLHRGKVQAISSEDFIKKVAAAAEGNRFEVHTPNAVAGIRGSNMLVGFTQGKTVVIFIAGHGYLYNPQMPQLVIPVVAGQMSFVVGEQQTPSLPTKAPEGLTRGEGEAFIQVEQVTAEEKATETEAITTASAVTPPAEAPITQAEPPTFTTSLLEQEPVTQDTERTLVEEITETGAKTNFTGTMGFLGGEAIFTASIPKDQSIGTMSASGVYSGSMPTTLEGWLYGTSDKGGAFYGPLAGIEGSLLTRMAAFYVEENSLSFLTGDAPGTYDGTTFAISGSLAKSSAVGTVTLTPNPSDPTLLGALEYSMGYGETPQFFPTDRPIIISDSGIQITPRSFRYTAPHLITNEGRRVAVIGNIYEGTLKTNAVSNLPYLGYVSESDDEYALGPLFYSHDTANSRFTIDTNLKSIGKQIAGYDEESDPIYGWYLGTYSMKYFGKYEDSSFRMAGAGTYVGEPASFFGSWNLPGSLYYNDSGKFIHAGYEQGLWGGLTQPWTSPASFLAIGSYSLDSSDKPHYLMNSFISGGTPETDDGASIDGFAAAIWKDGSAAAATVGTISDGTIRTFYVSPPDATTGKIDVGIMKGVFAGNYYDISPDPMWSISGTLTPTPVVTLNSTDFVDYKPGDISGGLSGTFGGKGGIYGLDDGNGEILYLYTESPQSAHFGIFNIRFGIEGYPNYYFGKPAGNTSWIAKLGGSGEFDNDEDGGYWLADVSAGTWTDTGEITGNITGKAITPLSIYDMEGRFIGVNQLDTETWIGQAIGSYQTATPTDFGGDWYHSTLYNDFGDLAWNSEGEDYGTFGFVKRTDGKYAFLAIGEFIDYGYGVEEHGGPYILSGSIYYGGQTLGRNIEAFTGAIWKKADPSDTSGTIAGYTSAVYYTEAGKVGLIKGPLTGDFYEMVYYEDEYHGMWQVQSGADGLTTIDKTASLPAGFDIQSAAIDSDDSLSAHLAGAFTGGTKNTIFADYYSGKTKFITYADGDQPKSLPFGIYNMKLGGYNYEYNYEAKPIDASVGWSAKIGGEGGFGVNSSDKGYWLADIGGTWAEYGEDAGHGIIDGILSGKYITQTHMGTIGGPFYGLYTEEDIDNTVGSGTWVGMSAGTYEGTPLTSSLKLSTTGTLPTASLWRALPGTYYEGEFGQYDASSYEYYEYEYEYIKTESGKGYGYVYDSRASDGYYEKIYLPNGIMWKMNGDMQITTWDIEDIEGVRELPQWLDTSKLFAVWYSEWPGVELLEHRSMDFLDARLGMTGYPWNTGGTPVTIIGKYTASDSDYTKPTIITTPLLYGKFYSDYVEGGETPNGAYAVSLGGFIDNTSGVQLAMTGLYTNGSTAGVLRDAQLLKGGLYKDMGMWDAEGQLVATVMNSNFASNPAGVTIDSLAQNVVTTPFELEIAGRLTGDSGSFFDTMVNSGGTHFIKGQDWGIFTTTMWSGGFGVTSTQIPETWSAQVVGEGQFGEYKDASEDWQPDLGMIFIPELTGTLSDGVVKASSTGNVGKFMTMTKMGTISDVGLLGVYTQPSPVTPKTLYPWQGVSGGVWKTTGYLTFASEFETPVSNLRHEYAGGLIDNNMPVYNYSFDDNGYGEITFSPDATHPNTTRIVYEPDAGPFATPMWEKYTYDNTLSEFTYEKGTYNPSSLSHEFFSELAVNEGYQPANHKTDLGPTFSDAGYISAIMGGVGDLWSATSSSPADVYFLGEYENEYKRPSFFDAEIVSYNITNDTYTTLDGHGAYVGYIGGNEKDGVVDGWLNAIYLKDNGDDKSQAGILSGSFTGQAYNDIEMWQGQGSIYPVSVKNQAIPLSPSELYENIYEYSLGAHMHGTFDNGTEIKGVNDYSLTYAIYNEPWGIYALRLTEWSKFEAFETLPTSWAAKVGMIGDFGAYMEVKDGLTSIRPDDGYWLADITGTVQAGATTTDGKLLGSLTGKYLTDTRLGTMAGDVYGIYNTDSAIQMLSLGTWTGTPLKFVSNMSAYIYETATPLDANDFLTMDVTGWMDTRIGGIDSLWKGSDIPITILGMHYKSGYGDRKPEGIWYSEIRSHNITDNTDTTLDGQGAYYGYIGGNEKDGVIDGGIGAIYLKKIDDINSQAGILLGSFEGQAYQEIMMWEGQGAISPPVSLMEDVSILYTDLVNRVHVTDLYIGDGTASLILNDIPIDADSFVYDLHYMALSDASQGSFVGVWQYGIGGMYTGITPNDSWTALFEYIDLTDPTRIVGYGIEGTKWSDGIITGKTTGYGADLNPPQPVTWVSAGETKGTFNPTLTTFQMMAIGPTIETNTYLKLAATEAGRAKLQQLNIPAVQVGVATLTGSGNNFTNLSMTDVKFFATSAGGKPSVWATKDVSGIYTAQPTIDKSIPLSGGGLNADFTFKRWNADTGKWLGSVNGTGGFNGSTTFKGAAAGTGAAAGSGSISGTAAGVAK